MPRAIVVVAAVLVSACSASSSAPDASVGGCQPYVSTANLSTPTVSFGNDVMPIFRGSCALTGSCHGDPSVVAEERPFLGYADADAGSTDFQAIIDGLVGTKSKQDLSMNIVTARDAANSFLMHKMDDDQCTLIPQCMVGNSFRPNCGVFMPYQFPNILDVATRDLVRRWIHQGAQNN